MNFRSGIATISFTIFSLLFLTGCEVSYNLNRPILSETLSSGVSDQKEKEQLETGEKIAFERFDLLGKSVAYISYNKIKEGFPPALMEQINQTMATRLEESQFFEKILPEEEQKLSLQKDRLMKQNMEVYMDSLINVSVSNKDLSVKLARFFDVENFLVFQIDLWPCTNCLGKDAITMKLKLIEAESGKVIWAALSQRNAVELSGEELEVETAKQAEELINSFYHKFKRKWHIKRYLGLASLQ